MPNSPPPTPASLVSNIILGPEIYHAKKLMQKTHAKTHAKTTCYKNKLNLEHKVNRDKTNGENVLRQFLK